MRWPWQPIAAETPQPIPGLAFMVLFVGFDQHDPARLHARLEAIVRAEFGADAGQTLVAPANEITGTRAESP